MRDLLIPEGWTASNSRGYATVIHPSGVFAIAVAGGDGYTGNEEATPSTRSAKGPATKDAVADNQLTFFDYKPDVFGPLPPSATHHPKQTWILLHCLDRSIGLIRAELSLPADMSAEGFVGIWHERIVLTNIPFEPDASRIDITPIPDSGADSGQIDIPVRRKAAN